MLLAREGDTTIGFSELHLGTPGLAELTFLGLLPAHIGGGRGRWLLRETCRAAWGAPRVAQVRVNTCTLDHPAALPNYLRAGFRVTGRSVETFPDPRLSGLLPPDVAPQLGAPV